MNMTPEHIKQLGTIMGIWAHPDDETFMMAGLMAAAAQNGQNVVCVTATKGEAGSQDPLRWPLTELAGIRSLELVEALQILGVKHHHWMSYPDGGCTKVPDDQAVAQLEPLIARHQPDTIITFPPDGLTGHEDHKAVSRWATKVAAKSAKPVAIYYGVVTQEMYNSHFKEMDSKMNIFFNIAQPRLYQANTCDLLFTLPPDIAQKKHRALEIMPSQYATMFQLFPERFLQDAFATEAFVSASKPG